MRKLLSFAFAALLAAPAAAQCSKLTVDGTGKAGTTLKFTLSGAAKRKPAVLFFALKTGKTTIKVGPLGTLELGLASPVIPLFMRMTDAKGTATTSIRVPNGAKTAISLHGQGTSVELVIRRGPPSLKFCTSNVAAFKIGG